MVKNKRQVIVTLSAINKKLEIDKKLEKNLEIYKNLEIKLEIPKINSKFIAILNSNLNSKFSSFCQW